MIIIIIIIISITACKNNCVGGKKRGGKVHLRQLLVSWVCTKIVSVIPLGKVNGLGQTLHCVMRCPPPVNGAGRVGMMADTLAQVCKEQAQVSSKYCRGLGRVRMTGEKWSRCSVTFTLSCFILWKRTPAWQLFFFFSKRRLLVSKSFWLVKKEG